jgi:hypothetical protein
MQITVRNLIRQSMLFCNVVAPGQALKAQEAEDGLFMLNIILEQMNLQDTLTTHTRIVTHTLVPNTYIYTIGESTADISTIKPSVIKAAYIRDSLNLDTELDIIPFALYESYEQKDLTSDSPESLSYQSTNPNGTIYLYPVPTTVKTLRLEIAAKFAMAELDDTLDLPDGYTEMIMHQLCEQICVVYKRFDVIPRLQELARKVNAVVKAKNSANLKRPMQLDPIFIVSPTGQQGSTYNPYSDT